MLFITNPNVVSFKKNQRLKIDIYFWREFFLWLLRNGLSGAYYSFRIGVIGIGPYGFGASENSLIVFLLPLEKF
jgi:hypothetical protein